MLRCNVVGCIRIAPLFTVVSQRISDSSLRCCKEEFKLFSATRTSIIKYLLFTLQRVCKLNRFGAFKPKGLQVNVLLKSIRVTKHIYFVP